MAAIRAAAQPVDHLGWPVTIGVGQGSYLNSDSVSIADLEGDGELELIFTWQSWRSSIDQPGAVEIRRRTGAASASFPITYVWPFPAILDGDDDGRLEFAIGNQVGVRVFDCELNLNWNFQSVPAPDFYTISGPQVAVADLDGDGRPWLVLVSQNDWVYVFGVDGAIRSGFPLYLRDNEEGSLTRMNPTIVDLDGDGRDEILKVGNNGGIHCIRHDATLCAGFPFHSMDYTGTRDLLDDSPMIAYRTALGDIRLAAIGINSSYYHPDSINVWILDRFGQPVAVFNDPLLEGRSLSMLDVSGRPTILVSDQCSYDSPSLCWNRLIDGETGLELPGSPIQICTAEATGTPVTGEILPGGQLGWLQGGYGNYDDPTTRVDAVGVDGTRPAGFPWPTGDVTVVNGVQVGTLDGVETTACWTPSAWSDGLSEGECIDLGVPWDRGRVHFPMRGFDLQRTNRYRRLWQIDRALTNLTIPVTEIPSEGAAPFWVTVSPRKGDGSTLGADQQVRIARRPVVGRFVGQVQYDPATGDYRRLYEPPNQAASADVEFRVFVNEELDDTKPVLHIRGRVRLDAADPRGVPIGGPSTSTLVITGTELSRVVSLASTSPDLTLLQWSRSGATLSAVVRARLSARVGWAGLQATADDGRTSNVLPVFLYDPGSATLLGRENTAGVAKFEWFGGAGMIWSLERSPSPTMVSPSRIHHGGRQPVDDPEAPPAGGCFFYQVSPF